MEILTFKEISAIINEFRKLEDRNLVELILNSEIIYENDFYVGFGDCSLTIFNYNNHLYIRTIVDDVDSLEPLLIQVEDDGSVIDFILLDFVLKFKNLIDLKKYFVLQTDYGFIMDRIRTIE